MQPGTLILGAAVWIALTILARSQGPPMDAINVAWETQFGGANGAFRDYDARDLDEAPDGGFLIGGHRDGQAWMARVSATGQAEWQISPRFVVANFHDEVVERVLASADGSHLAVVATGSSTRFLGGAARMFFLHDGPVHVAKFDRGGRESWRRQLADAGEAKTLAGSTEGAAFVGLQTERWARLFKVSKGGEVIWERKWEGNLADTPLAPTADGGGAVAFAAKGQIVHPCETSISPDLPRQIAVSRFDSLGQELWRADYASHARDTPVSIAAVDGAFLVGARRHPSSVAQTPFGGEDCLVVRLDPNGVRVWERAYGGFGQDSLVALLPRGDGGCQIAALSGSTPSGGRRAPRVGLRDLWVANLDRNGLVLSESAVGSSDSTALEQGGVFAVGERSVAVVQGQNGQSYLAELTPGVANPTPKVMADVAFAQVCCVESAGPNGLVFLQRFADSALAGPMADAAWALRLTKQTGFGKEAPVGPVPGPPLVADRESPGASAPLAPLFQRPETFGLTLTPASRGNQAYARILTATGMNYTVESGATLDAWEELLTVAGDGKELIFPLIVNRLESRRFFRLRVSCAR